ncbi:acyltransferase [Simiduia agarivorans]|uniref:Hexapeptide repeat-containing transferase n=1 Tax=Simiduia agarivorans (strain DSM 21679 / JCM 13881 / BCRC 17597 / SA1) TaxID=1117647 RepID=K4KUK5_SIMAS|nr:acyltransferase [Simiduia agarivorans]AFU97637.2 hexapeptide repeat-containing transferase [Simiduia agarivorans SA1 = DSM 21679]
MTDNNAPYREQHKQRLNFMPWLYFTLKDKHKLWATEWQNALQQRLAALETVTFGEHCFVAENANLFAEPGRTIQLGDSSFIAANCFLHGPIQIGRSVSINQDCKLEGSRGGIVIGDYTRIAAGCALYAFNHGTSALDLISTQPITSKGITIGKDVWIGAHCGITDGVQIGDHAIIGMNSTVTRNVAPWSIMAGSPARKIGDRRDSK